ncbi:amidohydrolase [Paraburkholderia acidicola]|uniref:Amidohydrolase n=1 Tax=Paraburkholderia acidicola TaxID=1912599 RepID=A0A2A4EUH6_9BURK|nr:amidohydrolase family protein [Paraburkholderia acidicola]PCE25273.1 amidohydrolase [Paraburkholderia acidicola]
MANEVQVPTAMREATTNTRPAFALPHNTCDVHFHVFEQGYPSVKEPHYTFPDGTLEQYLAMCRYIGIERMVLVQPSYYGTDNRLTIDTLGKLGSRARAIVMVEETVTDAELERFHAAGVRGIRLDLFARAGWARPDIQAYILRMIERARPFGWHIQFYTPGYVVRDLIPFLATVEYNFVIDHMGYMLEEDGLTGHDFEQLLGLLKRGFAWLKLSAPYRIARGRGYGAVEHLARAIIETRSDRALWGTDWPHLTDGSRDTGELVNLLLDWTTDEATRNRILVDNPQSLFGFDE